MAHDHGHQHQTSNERRVFWALIITAAFMLVEVAGGLISGSLALLADAGHMLTDAIALLFSWIAFRAARNPADDKRSYGYHRLQIVAAFVNGLTLVVVVGWIVIEAVRRIAEPVAILGDTMLAVAVAGLIVNVAAFWIIHGGDRNNLNLASAAAHVMGERDTYIALRQILPNIVSPLIVNATVRLGFVILIIAALSFLGLGSPPPTPDWGADLASARDYMEKAPMIAVWPGLMICYTVLAFNLFGDGLRDILDPRITER